VSILLGVGCQFGSQPGAKVSMTIMPSDGESRMDAAEVYMHCLLRITELTAGSEGELLRFADCWPASDDRRQEMELARLICSSSESCAALIAACAVEARAILRRHEHMSSMR
jgi:hypothetical protein